MDLTALFPGVDRALGEIDGDIVRVTLYRSAYPIQIDLAIDQMFNSLNRLRAEQARLRTSRQMPIPENR